MGLSDRFNRGAQAPQTANAATAKGGNRYAGIEPRREQANHPDPGDYVFEVTEAAYDRRPADYKEYYKATLAVVEAEGHGATPAGQSVVFLQFVTPAGVQVIRDFLMAANGFDELDKFNGWAATVPEAQVEAVVGKRVLARVTLGKADGNGGHYREWMFAPAE